MVGTFNLGSWNGYCFFAGSPSLLSKVATEQWCTSTSYKTNQTMGNSKWFEGMSIKPGRLLAAMFASQAPQHKSPYAKGSLPSDRCCHQWFFLDALWHTMTKHDLSEPHRLIRRYLSALKTSSAKKPSQEVFFLVFGVFFQKTNSKQGDNS